MGSAKEKVRVNVYVDKSLTCDAKKLGINLSNSLENALKQELSKKWLEQNQEKIQKYNQHIAAKGLPFDDEDICV
ncbi:type II toxin-antitoxin system CcdA family antitoxin [Alteromonas sp. LMIT006]|uniref:type II toxin-antitoxin system CcdA family antitoxin n=1 Tax=Alteromonadaceae TaxID=72275 RepID=UPI0020CA7199|nr:type II toxin-antitoxin system CcdA family antitoxin [Alteromonas sp. LMIT006]UTP72285.1 type II toxin-antitoxin system CcdA family antitoxin [Alteromonas sp. LMIT006]